MNFYALASSSSVHALAAVFWVGSMFFSLYILKAGLGMVDGALRLQMLDRILRLLFAWVWAFVVLIFLSGWIILHIKYRPALDTSVWSWPVWLMMIFGHIMILNFFYIFFVLYKKFRSNLEIGDFGGAAQSFVGLRLFILINFYIGTLLVAAAVYGKFV